jgi:hypothetical protein
VEEVPRVQLALLALDDQQTGAGQDEKPLLRILSVIPPQRLTRLEEVDVDAELPERPLALEVAGEAERPVIPPAAVPCVEHEPALDVGDEAVLRLPERRLGNHSRTLPENVLSLD